MAMTHSNAPSARRPGRFTRLQVNGLTLALLLLQGGCAANTPNEAVGEKTAPYYQDAQLCRAKNPARTLPPGADPAANLDTDGYLRCMSQQGYQQDAKTDPLLVALKKCRQTGTTSVSASGATRTRAPSPAAVRDCLKQRGFPSTGEPPAAAAAVDQETPTPAPKATLKLPGKKTAGEEAPPDAAKERIQTIYIPRKTPSP